MADFVKTEYTPFLVKKLTETSNFGEWFLTINEIIDSLNTTTPIVEEHNEQIEYSINYGQITSNVNAGVKPGVTPPLDSLPVTNCNNYNELTTNGVYYIPKSTKPNAPSTQSAFLVYVGTFVGSNKVPIVVQIAQALGENGKIYTRSKNGSSWSTSWNENVDLSYIDANYFNVTDASRTTTVKGTTVFEKSVTCNSTLKVENNLTLDKDLILQKNGKPFKIENASTSSSSIINFWVNNPKDKGNYQTIIPLKIDMDIPYTYVVGEITNAYYLMPSGLWQKYDSVLGLPRESDKKNASELAVSAQAVYNMYRYNNGRFMPYSGGTFTGIVRHNDDIILNNKPGIGPEEYSKIKCQDDIEIDCLQRVSVTCNNAWGEIQIDRQEEAVAQPKVSIFGARTKTFNKELEFPIGELVYTLGCTEIAEDSIGLRLRKKDTTGSDVPGHSSQALVFERITGQDAVTNEDTEELYFRPTSDDLVDIGSPSIKFKDIYTSSGSLISISDERVLENIDKIPDEIVNIWKNIEWKSFKFASSVEKESKLKIELITAFGKEHNWSDEKISEIIAKYFDNYDGFIDYYSLYDTKYDVLKKARIHTGVVAQNIHQIVRGTLVFTEISKITYEEIVPLVNELAVKKRITEDFTITKKSNNVTIDSSVQNLKIIARELSKLLSSRWIELRYFYKTNELTFNQVKTIVNGLTLVKPCTVTQNTTEKYISLVASTSYFPESQDETDINKVARALTEEFRKLVRSFTFTDYQKMSIADVRSLIQILANDNLIDNDYTLSNITTSSIKVTAKIKDLNTISDAITEAIKQTDSSYENTFYSHIEPEYIYRGFSFVYTPTLDLEDYGFFCFDKWNDIKDTEVYTASEKYQIVVGRGLNTNLQLLLDNMCYDIHASSLEENITYNKLYYVKTYNELKTIKHCRDGNFALVENESEYYVYRYNNGLMKYVWEVIVNPLIDANTIHVKDIEADNKEAVYITIKFPETFSSTGTREKLMSLLEIITTISIPESRIMNLPNTSTYYVTFTNNEISAVINDVFNYMIATKKLKEEDLIIDTKEYYRTVSKTRERILKEAGELYSIRYQEAQAIENVYLRNYIKYLEERIDNLYKTLKTLGSLSTSNKVVNEDNEFEKLGILNTTRKVMTEKIPS